MGSIPRQFLSVHQSLQVFPTESPASSLCHTIFVELSSDFMRSMTDKPNYSLNFNFLQNVILKKQNYAHLEEFDKQKPYNSPWGKQLWTATPLSHTYTTKQEFWITHQRKDWTTELCHFLLAIRKQKVNGGISTRYGKVKIFSSYFPHLYSCMYCFLTCTSYFQTGMLIFG